MAWPAIVVLCLLGGMAIIALLVLIVMLLWMHTLARNIRAVWRG